MSATRFAPSPTGLLHVGHAFAALTAFDAAMQMGGRFILRIEDIDVARCRKEFETAIKTDLAWLGIHWDEPVRRQSEHFSDYRAALQTLDRMGVLYSCFCTRKEIAEEVARAGEAPHGPEGALYPGTCRALSSGEVAQRQALGAPYALRLNVAKARAIAGTNLFFEETGKGPDGEHGHQTAQPEMLGDIVLGRKELPSSYHLAVVVDDALQGVTLVTRGQDLFHATHVQRLLQALLGLPVPAYAHHCLILDTNGKKFSKRDGGAQLLRLREQGITPSAVRELTGLDAASTL